jgi:hypothetical protein
MDAMAIRAFEKIEGLALDGAIRERICPKVTFTVNESEWCTAN